MAWFDPILELFSADRRFQGEAKQWQSTGDFPEVVIRVYRDQGLRLSDGSRMSSLGYRVLSEEVSPLRQGVASRRAGQESMVTYTNRSD